jgi:hypothetical protein
MNPKYEVGQEVVVKYDEARNDLSRDSTLEQYIDQVGKVTHYYWISPRAGDIFYLYMVRFPTSNKDVVLHEDEIRPYHG